MIDDDDDDDDDDDVDAMVVLTRLRQLAPKPRSQRKPADTELSDSDRRRYEQKPPEDQQDQRVVYEDQSYEAPVQDYGRQAAENYQPPICESADAVYVEEEYQELGEADINYVVSPDSDA